MGHAIHYIEVDEKANKNSVMTDIHEHARRDGDSGYSSKMTWHDEISPLLSREEAEAFIEAHDKGFYDDHAVRFFDYSGATKTAKITEYEMKIAELMKAKQKYIAEHSVRNFQAKYIGCPKCGSKINKDYLRAERCPLCGMELRSQTTLDKIKWFDTKIEDYRNRVDMEKMKQKNKAKIKWLVKYEYHC